MGNMYIYIYIQYHNIISMFWWKSIMFLLYNIYKSLQIKVEKYYTWETGTYTSVKPVWNYFLCSEQTGVWFIQVRLSFPTLGLYLKFSYILYMFQVYSGSTQTGFTPFVQMLGNFVYFYFPSYIDLFNQKLKSKDSLHTNPLA